MKHITAYFITADCSQPYEVVSRYTIVHVVQIHQTKIIRVRQYLEFCKLRSSTNGYTLWPLQLIKGRSIKNTFCHQK